MKKFFTEEESMKDALYESKLDEIIDEFFELTKERKIHFSTAAKYLMEKVIDAIIRNSNGQKKAHKHTLMSALIKKVIDRVMYGPWKD